MGRPKTVLTTDSSQDMSTNMDTKTLESLDPTRNKKERIRVIARMAAPLHAELVKRAKAGKTSFNAYLSHVIVEYLKKN